MNKTERVYDEEMEEEDTAPFRPPANNARGTYTSKKSAGDAAQFKLPSSSESASSEDSNDSDIPIPIQKPKGNAKAKENGRKGNSANKRRDSTGSSDVNITSFDDPLLLTEVAYRIQYMGGNLERTCSVYDFRGNQKDWAVKCGACNSNQVDAPTTVLPVFGYRTADQKETATPTFLIDDRDWRSLVQQIKEREKVIKEDKKKKRRPQHSLMPITIVRMDLTGNQPATNVRC